MALDYFRSVPSRLAQRGLQGLAADQAEIDAEDERRRQEEERRKQLDAIRKQYDDATAQPTQDASQTSFRDDALAQARSRFEELTQGIGQGFSDLGTEANREATALGQRHEAGRAAIGEGIGSALDAATEPIRGRYEAGQALASDTAQRGPQSDFDAWRQRNTVPMEPGAQPQLDPTATWTGGLLKDKDLNEAEKVGGPVDRAVDAALPGEGTDPFSQAGKATVRALVRGATALPRSYAGTAEGVYQTMAGAGERDPGKVGKGLLQTGASGIGMMAALNPRVALGTLQGDITAEGLEQAKVPEDVSELAGGAVQLLTPGGGLGDLARATREGSALRRLTKATGALDAAGDAEALSRLEKAGTVGGALAGGALGAYRGWNEAAPEGEADPGKRAVGAFRGGVQGLDVGAGMGPGVVKTGAGVVRAPRGVLERTGDITGDMSLAEGVKGAVTTRARQAGAAVRGAGEDLAGALTREGSAGGRPVFGAAEGKAGAAEDAPEMVALRQEQTRVNQQRGQAAQALGKARVKVGSPDKEPAGLTPETRGIWDAYVEASRRGKEINDEMARLRQGAAAAAPRPEDLLGEPTGVAPPNVPRQGRGGYTPPMEALEGYRTATGVVEGQPESFQSTPQARSDIAMMRRGPRLDEVEPTRMAGEQGAPPPFYSALTRAVDTLPEGRLSPAQVAKQLLTLPDVKREQLTWSGLSDYLTGKLQANGGRGEAVTRAELQGWLRDNDVRVYEIQKGSLSDPARVAQLKAAMEQAEAAGNDAWSRSQEAERQGESRAWSILGGIEDRMRETPEGQRALDPSGMGYGADVQGTAMQVIWGYPNLPKDRPFREALEREALVGGYDPDDPETEAKWASATPQQKHDALAYNHPVLAEATDAEWAELEALRSEYQTASAEQTRANTAFSDAERAYNDAKDQTLPGGPSKWLDYAEGGLYLPGAEDPRANVREFLLTLGPRSTMPDQSYTGHWDEPNIIAHVRMSDRVTPDGKRVLVIEELQSDWHQAARRKLKDDQGRPILDAQGKIKRVGYYQGRRPVEEARASQDWAEYQRLHRAQVEAGTAYQDFTNSGRQQQANEAFQAAANEGIERARAKLVEMGIPDESLGRLKNGWMGRALDRSGNRIPDPVVLVRYSFPGDTAPERVRAAANFGTSYADAAQPTNVEVLDWAPGYSYADDDASRGVAALSARSREEMAKEEALWGQVGNRLTPEDTVYAYTTRAADAVMQEMAEVDPEVAPLKRAFLAEDAEMQRLERARSGSEQQTGAHLRQFPDLRDVEMTDRLAAMQERIAALRQDPAVQGWARRNDAQNALQNAMLQAQTRLRADRAMEQGGVMRAIPREDEDFAIRSDPEVQAALRDFEAAVGEAKPPPLRGDELPMDNEAYREWDARMKAEEGTRRDLSRLEREARNLEQSLAQRSGPEARHDMAGKPPAGPFQGEGWQRLALKRMLHLAAREGYDYLGITPGDIQAQRYNPFRGMNVEALTYDKNSQILTVERGRDQYGDTPDAAEQRVPPEELAQYVGEGVAERLLAGPAGDPTEAARTAAPGAFGVNRVTKADYEGSLVMEDAMGAGMRKSYDDRIPGLLTEQARQFGSQAHIAPETDPERAYQRGAAAEEGSGVLLYPDKPPEEIIQERGEGGDVRTRPNFQPLHMLPITPEMQAAQGERAMFPLFLRQGAEGGVGSDGSVGTDDTFRPDRRLDVAGQAVGAVGGALRGYANAEEEDERRRARGEAGVSPFMKLGQALFGAGLGATGGKMAVRGARLASKMGTPGAARGAALLDFVRANPMSKSMGFGTDARPGEAGKSGAVLHRDYAEEWLNLDRSPARILENKAATLEREAEDTRRKQQAFQRRVDKGIANENEADEAEELADLLKEADRKAKEARTAATAARTSEDASLASLKAAGGTAPKNQLFEGLEGLAQPNPKTGKPRPTKLGPIDRDMLNQALLDYKVGGVSVDLAAARAGIKKADLVNVIDDLGIRRTKQQGGAILAERNAPEDRVGGAKPPMTLESLEAEDREHAAMGDVWWREPLTPDEEEGLTRREIKKLRVERGLTPEGRRPKPKNPHVYIDLDGNTQYADSTYEAVVFRMLDELKQQGTVAYWQRGLIGDQAFKFNEAMLEKWRGLPVVTKEGIQAAFAPDFFVVTRDPETGEYHMEVIEVKNTGIYARPEWRVPEKLAQGQEFLEQNGIGYRLFTGDQIGRSSLASLQDSDLAPNAQGRMGMPDPVQRQALLGALTQDFGQTQVAPRIRLGEWKNQTVPPEWDTTKRPRQPMDIPESRYPPGEEPAEEPLFPGEKAGLGRTFSERMGEKPGQTVHELLSEFNRRSLGAKLIPDASEAIGQMRPKAEDAIARFRAAPKEADGNKGLTYNPITMQPVPKAPGSGYVVSPFGHAEMTFKGEDVHPVALAAWMSEHRRLLQDPEVRVGFWYDRKAKKTTIDLVVETPDRADAETLGRTANQYAIFHLGDQTGAPQIDLDYGATGRLEARPTRQEELDAFERWRDARSGGAPADGATGRADDAGAPAGGRPGAEGSLGRDVAPGLDRAGGLEGAATAPGGDGSEGRVPAASPVLPTGARTPAPYRGPGAPGGGVGGRDGGGPDPGAGRFGGLLSGIASGAREHARPADWADTAATAGGALLGAAGEIGLEPGEEETPEDRLKRIIGGGVAGAGIGLTARRQGARAARVLGNLPEMGRLAREETGSLTLPSGAVANGATAAGGVPGATPKGKAPKPTYAEVKARMQEAIEGGADEAEIARLEKLAEQVDPGERTAMDAVTSGYKLGMLMTVRGITRQIAGGVTVGAWQPGERWLAGTLAQHFGGSRTADQPLASEAGAMLRSTFNKANLSQALAEAWASAGGKTTGAAGAGAEALAAHEGKRPGSGLKGAANRAFDRGFQVFSVSDTFFNRLASNAEMAAVAHRLAKAGEGSGATEAERVADLLANDQRVHDAGAAAAKYRTLQQDLDRYGKAVDGMRQTAGPLGAFVMPFWKTPYNGMKYDLERSPVGLGKTIYQAAKGGNANISETEKYERFARGILGTGMSLALLKLALDGNLSGPEPRDQAEREAWRAEGKTPYSVRIKTPGGNRWVAVNQVPGMNATLTQVMGVHDYIDRRVRAGSFNPADAKTYDGMVTSLVFGTGDAMLRRPFFDTLQGVLQAVEEGSGQPADDDSGPSAMDAVGTVGKTFIPGALREAERATGTVDRAPRNAGEALKSIVPGLSGQVPERRDAFGRVQTRVGSGSGNAGSEILGGIERLLNPMPGQAERPSPRRYLNSKSLQEDAAIAAVNRKLDRYTKDPVHAPRPTDAEFALLGRHGTSPIGTYSESRRLARERAKMVAQGETPYPAYDEALAKLRAVTPGGKGGGGLPSVARFLVR